MPGQKLRITRSPDQESEFLGRYGYQATSPLKRAYTAGTLVDATLVADWLNSNGVPCEIFHQSAGGALGELPVTPPEVWVRRNADMSLALKLLEDVVFEDQDGEHCCSHCGEASPVSFDICWHCQSPLSRV